MKIIAELGINHRGSAQIAEQLIDIAAKAGAWGAKFQYRSKTGFYQAISEIGDEILSREIDESYIAPEEILRLAGLIRQKGLRAGSVSSSFRTPRISVTSWTLLIFSRFRRPN